MVRVAVEAGKADDLRARTEARAGQPLGELPAKLLLTVLALKTKDEARTARLFEALSERVKKDALQSTNNRITTVVLAAFAQPEHAKMLRPIVEKLADNHVTGSNTTKAAEMRLQAGPVSPGSTRTRRPPALNTSLSAAWARTCAAAATMATCPWRGNT